MSQTFRPEFVNRLDKIIVFKTLARDLVRGWRSGRLDAVLRGDFDLIGWVKGGQPEV